MGALFKCILHFQQSVMLVVATFLFAIMMSPAFAEQKPSLPAPDTVQSTGAWFFVPNNFPPSGITSLYDGYPSGQAACDAYASWSYGPGSTASLNFLQIPGFAAQGFCSGYSAYNDWVAGGYLGVKLVVGHFQNCPPGYRSNDPGFGYISDTSFTCINMGAPRQCPPVPPGEQAFTLDPGGLTCSRSDRCLPPNIINPSTDRCEQPSYTITLEPNGAYLPAGGSYTIEPSTMLSLRAVVKDQTGLPKAGVPVSLSVDVKDGTGGHEHSDNRPKGRLSCSLGPVFEKCPNVTTDASGNASFDFSATPVSGTHTISAFCTQCGNSTSVNVDVKVDGLIPIPDSTKYALRDSAGSVIGAKKGAHTKNHFLTSDSIRKLNKLVDVYKAINPSAKLYLNDASLEWGGLFDVNVVNTPWSAPHSTHQRGASLDIRAANSGPYNEGAIPTGYFEDFIDSAQKKGLRLGLHCMNSSDTSYCLGQPNNRHFHIDF